MYHEAGEYLADTDAPLGILPEESGGNIKPEIWGNHTYFIGDTAATPVATAARSNNLVKAQYIGTDDSGNYRFLIDRRRVYSLEKIFALDPALGRFVQLSAFTIEHNIAPYGCIISVAPTVPYYDYIFSDGTNSNDQSNGSSWNGLTQANDSNFSTYSNSLQLSPDEYPIEARNDLDFSGYQKPSDATISAVGVFAKAKWEKDATILVGEIVFGVNQTSIKNQIAEDTALVVACGTEAATEAGVNANVEIRHYKNASDGDHESQAYVYEVWKRVTYTRTERLNVYFAGQGHEYGDWINDRSTDDGYTETHEDNGKYCTDTGEGDLAENFAGAIESGLRDLISLENTEIDRDTFNIASKAVPVASYKCSASLLERTPIQDFLFSLCRDCRSWLWWQTDGTVKMKVMEDTYGASDRTIDARDVTNLSFDRTPIRDIKTAVDVRYNFSQDKYMSATGVSEDTDQQTKYNITKAQSTLIHKAPSIGDSTTAGNIRAFLLAFLKQPHNIVSGELGKIHLDLDLGDIIEFSNMDYKVHGETITANATRNSQTIYKYWWIFHVERSDSLKFKAIQLHDLS